MNNSYIKKCKCCREEFETNRIDQFFVNRLHQVSYNNKKQSNRRLKLGKYNKDISSTYTIFQRLLGVKSQVKKTKEFLRGSGVNLAVYTHTVEIDGDFVQCLYDILIFDKNEYIILKKQSNG
jgi:hypothetical protein